MINKMRERINTVTPSVNINELNELFTTLDTRTTANLSRIKNTYSYLRRTILN
jgi:hypothetical protein